MKGGMEEAAFFRLWRGSGRRSIALVLILILDKAVCRANPPEYLAATREPADNASELASPFEEVTRHPPGGRLAKAVSQPLLGASVFSREPRFYYGDLNDGT